MFVRLTNNKTMHIMLRAGKATLWHCIVVILQPPISAWGIRSELIPEKKIPMDNPRIVFASLRNSRIHMPKAIIIAPVPISALADQWQIGMLMLASLLASLLPQAQLSPQSGFNSDNEHTGNIICGLNAMSKPKIIIILPKINCFFMLCPL